MVVIAQPNHNVIVVARPPMGPPRRVIVANAAKCFYTIITTDIFLALELMYGQPVFRFRISPGGLRTAEQTTTPEIILA